MFQIERPYMLFALLILIPAILVCIFISLKIKRELNVFYSEHSAGEVQKMTDPSSRITRAIFFRVMMRAFAFVFAILALSGIQWGSHKVPVQNNGNAVCFVFDISYSMNAEDCVGKKSRLDSMKIFAGNLISRFENTSVAAVLAKGDGFVAVPMTEDYGVVYSLLENLSPLMMSSAGSSIGKGIQTAMKSFSENLSQKKIICVFTDGDETDGMMEESLKSAVKLGIDTTIIGFGSKEGAEIVAGDGKTKVRTSLKSELIKNAVQKANEFSFLQAKCHYSNYTDKSSAYNFLELINSKKVSETSYSYQIKPVARHEFFIFLSILFFALSFFNEFKLPKKLFSKITPALMMFFLTSCSSERIDMLKGSWNFYSGKKNTAIAQFLNVSDSDNSLVRDYAFFALSSVYILDGEYESALSRLDEIEHTDESLPVKFRESVFYNRGIIYERLGDFISASENFKEAILLNPKNEKAKVNLELCNREIETKNAQAAASQLQGVQENNEDSLLQKEIFNMIRENEGKQWKKMEQNQNQENVLDY